MERRVVIAIFLSFLVLYVYQWLVPAPQPAPKPANATTTGTSASAASTPRSETTPPAGSTPATPEPRAAAPTATALVGETSERDIRVETRDLVAVFTNRGARLKSWRLKHYRDRQKQPQELVEPIEPLPFTLQTGNEQVDASINAALYAVSGAPSGAADQPADLRFEYQDTAGTHVVKEFRLEPSSYVVTFRADVNAGGQPLVPAGWWGPAVGDAGENSRYVKKAEALLFRDGEVERVAWSDLATQPTYEGDFHYAGVDDNYFMVAALFPGRIKVTYRPLKIPLSGGSTESARDLIAFSIQPQRPGTAMKFFVGPKDFDVLASLDRDVVRAIDFGMFAVIVAPLLRSLKWVNGYVGNYGWSIIILTVIINGLMFPLRHKQVVSMRKMQTLQPEVKAIQDRYSKLKATDPAKQKMNQELMALYRERGVNPASGCVPMLLTLPFIFAFYALLSTAIELRGAPFVGWIQDLSAHDPLYVTPILMGISQVCQQWMTPMTGADPAQQKMMMFMPVIFTFMFLWAPAGLALYWFVSNLWAIGQQYATNYLIGPPPVHAVRPPAEGRMKRAGGGKTDAAMENTKN